MKLFKTATRGTGKNYHAKRATKHNIYTQAATNTYKYQMLISAQFFSNI